MEHIETALFLIMVVTLGYAIVQLMSMIKIWLFFKPGGEFSTALAQLQRELEDAKQWYE